MKRGPFVSILGWVLIGSVVLVAGPPVSHGEEEAEDLPAEAVLRLGSVAFRHPALVNAVACSPDGMRIASSSMGPHGNSVRIWDRRTGRLVHDLPPEGDIPFCVAFSPEGRFLVTAGSGDRVRLWNATTGMLVRTVSMVPAPGDSSGGTHIGMTVMGSRVAAVAFSPDGRYLALGGDCRKTFSPLTAEPGGSETEEAEFVVVRLSLVDVSTGKEIQRFEGHEHAVNDVAFSPDGATLAAADDRGLKVWDVESGRLRFECEGDASRGRPRAVSFSPDGNDLLVGFDVSVQVLDAKTGDVRKVLTRQGTVSAVVFSPNGKVAASTCWKTVHLWSTADWSEIRAFEGHVRHVTALAFVPGDEGLLVGAGGHLVRIWDTASGVQAVVPRGHEDALVDVAVSPDGALIASGSRDETVRLWDAKTGAERGVLGTHGGGVTALTFSIDGTVLASSGYDHRVCLWNGTTGAAIGEIQPQIYGTEQIAFSPDGRILVIGGRDGSLLFWDRQTRRPLRTMERLAGDGGMTTDLVFSADGKHLASAHWNGPVFLLDPETREVRLRLEPVHGHANALAFSPDGSRLAVAGSGADLKVLDVATGEAILERRAQGEVLGVAWSPDGGAIASCSADGSVLLWDARSGDVLRCFDGHDGPACAVVFSHDGRRLVSAGVDTTVLVWTVPTTSLGEPTPGTDRE